MTILHKIAAGVILAALVGGGFWYMQGQVQSKAEQVGRLEAEQAQLRQSLADAEVSANGLREQLNMWTWLYNDLQGAFKELSEGSDAVQAELAKLRERPDVKEFVACPMPDALYDWVRQN